MMPRLEPCDHTEHDAFAWAHVVLEAPKPAMFGNVLWTRSLMQDRRDADLMLKIAQGGCPFCLGNYIHTVDCQWFMSGWISGRLASFNVT